MMDILMSETCWAHKKWNKIASDIRLVFHSSTLLWSSHFPWARVWQHFGVSDVIYLEQFKVCCMMHSPSSKRTQDGRGPDAGTWQHLANCRPPAASCDGWPWRRYMKFLWAQAKRTFWGSFISLFPFLKKEQSMVRSPCFCDSHFKLTDSRIRQYEHYTVGGHHSGVPMNFLQLANNSGRASLGGGSATAPMASHEVEVRRDSTPYLLHGAESFLRS